MFFLLNTLKRKLYWSFVLTAALLTTCVRQRYSATIFFQQPLHYESRRGGGSSTPPPVFFNEKRVVWIRGVFATMLYHTVFCFDFYCFTYRSEASIERDPLLVFRKRIQNFGKATQYTIQTSNIQDIDPSQIQIMVKTISPMRVCLFQITTTISYSINIHISY